MFHLKKDCRRSDDQINHKKFLGRENKSSRRFLKPQKCIKIFQQLSHSIIANIKKEYNNLDTQGKVKIGTGTREKFNNFIVQTHFVLCDE